jgi:hypothetical protein
MAFAHVFLFVYAIGGDVAVHYIGKYITRSELSLEERIRVRDLRFIVDMTARSSLVLLLAVGFTWHSYMVHPSRVSGYYFYGLPI